MDGIKTFRWKKSSGALGTIGHFLMPKENGPFSPSL